MENFIQVSAHYPNNGTYLAFPDRRVFYQQKSPKGSWRFSHYISEDVETLLEMLLLSKSQGFKHISFQFNGHSTFYQYKINNFIEGLIRREFGTGTALISLDNLSDNISSITIKASGTFYKDLSFTRL